MKRLALLMPVALAACGGNGNSGTPVNGNSLVAAAEATSKQGSERVALRARVDVSGPFGRESFFVNGSGVFDDKAGTGALRLNLNLSAPLGGSTTLDEIFRHSVIWVRSPLITTFLPSGKEWLRFELAQEAQVLGLNFNAVTGQTPSFALSLLRRTTNHVSTVGKATIGGVETTHYRASLGVRNMVAGSRYKSLDAWVDDRDLVRRARLDFTTPVTTHGPAHTVVTMTFSDFGAPVSVSPPPTDQVLNNFPKVHE